MIDFHFYYVGSQYLRGTPPQGHSEARRDREVFEVINLLLGIPQDAISPQNFERDYIKRQMERGGQGALPLGCLPLWGREGVTLTPIQNAFEKSDSDRISPGL